MVYSVPVALPPDCDVVLILELAIVVTPHRNWPVASAPAVGPQPAGLAASASNSRRQIAAPSPFYVSGPSPMKTENWRSAITQRKGWEHETKTQERLMPVKQSLLRLCPALPAPAGQRQRQTQSQSQRLELKEVVQTQMGVWCADGRSCAHWPSSAGEQRQRMRQL